MSTFERRKLLRYPFHSLARLHAAPDSVTGELLDISLAGALFRSSRCFDVRTSESCEIRLLGLNRKEYFVARGEVAHTDGDYIGILFLPLNAGQRDSLGHIVDMNLGPIQSLEPDFGALVLWDK